MAASAASTLQLAPTEMSGSLTGLLGTVFKKNVDGQFVNALSDTPIDRCKNLAAFNDNAWVAVIIGVKRKPNVFRPAVSDQSLWLSKGGADSVSSMPYLPRGKRCRGGERRGS